MVFNIIIGRDDKDKEEFKEEGTIFLGKSYVKMGQATSLSNNVFMDVNRTHVVLVTGRRGSGKSYSLSVMAEEMARLEEELKKNISVLFFDTMGIFWTMKYPNDRQEKLLEKWNLKPEGLDVKIYTPAGYFEEYKKRGIATDESFTLKASELTAIDWCEVFDIKITDPIGIFIEKIIEELKEDKKDYDLDDIIDKINEIYINENIKQATENRFVAAKNWGLFSKEGIEIKNLVKPGQTSILDLSCYTISGGSNIKALVIGLISRKLLNERIAIRKKEAIDEINRIEREKQEMPLVWIMVDEAQEFIPREGKTAATDALVQLIREGRQPGISLVLATQQPGEIHRDVLTQSDIVIAHRLTARFDIEALNSMMQSYLVSDLQKYLNELPKLKGSAIVLDDNSERIYPIKVHPKRSWHGGEAPTAIKHKKEFKIELFSEEE